MPTAKPYQVFYHDGDTMHSVQRSSYAVFMCRFPTDAPVAISSIVHSIDKLLYYYYYSSCFLQ